MISFVKNKTSKPKVYRENGSDDRSSTIKFCKFKVFYFKNIEVCCSSKVNNSNS